MVNLEIHKRVYCDKCRIEYINFIEDFWTKDKIIKKLRKMGWYIGKNTYCPACRKSRNLHKRRSC